MPQRAVIHSSSLSWNFISFHSSCILTRNTCMTATVNTDKRVKTKYKVSEHSKNTEITQDEGEKKNQNTELAFLSRLTLDWIQNQDKLLGSKRLLQ